MLFVMQWKIKAGCAEKAVTKFLTTGAPFPGVNMIGRYHVPGSVQGWIILETQDVSAIYRHASEWAELLEWETSPVLSDADAGAACAAAWPNVLVDLTDK